MAWTKFQVLLAVVMVVTGSINTLSTKWADKMTSVGSDGVDRPFVHPFLQACGMFMGEILCLVAFKIIYWCTMRRGDTSESEMTILRGNQNFNPFIFLPPAMCDMTATSIMYIGLNLTYASSFQMLRGSVIIFTGLLSVAFLERVLKWREWSGIGFIISGLVVVGLSDFVSGAHSGNHGRNDVITGDELIIIAQVITATQMVYEEKFINKHNIPALQAVGWEGIFGFSVLGLLLVPFYYLKVGSPFSGNPRGVLEDPFDGLIQLRNNPWLICAFFGTVFSIAFFNFAGVSVTKELSATTRMVLDSVRTLVIWAVTLALGWQQFHYLQIVGFSLLILGMCVYNKITLVPCIRKLDSLCRTSVDNSDTDVLVVNTPASEATDTEEGDHSQA
ncbi:solute carrier family 35 member F6 [Cloeon dipterum]|uniref:solute carrier family 35 member F6 n=1 Tax=Cloeon dipterum TaxID=197152 RepID=UPI00321F74CD